MPLPCTVQKVETRKLVKVVDKEKEQEQYDLGSSNWLVSHSTWYMYITKCYMHVSSEKVLTFLKRMVRSWTSFSAVSITGWFFGRPPERDLQDLISGETFSLFLKMFTCNHELESRWVCPLHMYMYTIPRKCLKFKTFTECLWQDNV